MITLVELNNGTLLVGSTDLGWWDCSTCDDGTFAEHAQSIASGETEDWTLPNYSADFDDGLLNAVATWDDGEVTIIANSSMGVAADKFLGIIVKS